MRSLNAILEQSELISDCSFNECLNVLFDTQNKNASILFKRKNKRLKKSKK